MEGIIIVLLYMPEIPAPNIEFQNERDEIKKQLSEVKRKKSEGILKKRRSPLSAVVSDGI
jgi:hypothetical protein